MEEEEPEEGTFSRNAEELISVLHGVHCDNSQLQYYAEGNRGRRHSIMPLTPFVYEFFLFNSLYQVDWISSKQKCELAYHPEEFTESKKQREFVSFLKEHATQKPADLFRAFEPLLYVEKTEGDWTHVIPDSRISVLDGEKFFRDIFKLQILLEGCRTPSEIQTSNKIFDLLKECTRFIYQVRNNIFHGSKTLGDVYDPSQKQRIQVYELFLKGLTSLFFLAVGKHSAACDFVPCPIYSSSLPMRNTGEVIGQSAILGATNKSMMKVGDSKVIARFTKAFPPPGIDSRPSARSSLFYPSANIDFLTPIILGLPYCTQFYFFERHRPSGQLPRIGSILEKIQGIRFPMSHLWKSKDGRDLLDFEFNGISRSLHWVHADNLAMLEEDVDLQFYFHRGDSWGEGGSGQEWDSRLLPALRALIPMHSPCIYLTDGHPGGLGAELSSESFELTAPSIDTGSIYYCGRLPGMDAAH